MPFHDMMRRGDLLPGEKVHQVDVAKMIGVSGSPLREALHSGINLRRRLQAEDTGWGEPADLGRCRRGALQ